MIPRPSISLTTGHPLINYSEHQNNANCVKHRAEIAQFSSSEGCCCACFKVLKMPVSRGVTEEGGV